MGRDWRTLSLHKTHWQNVTNREAERSLIESTFPHNVAERNDGSLANADVQTTHWITGLGTTGGHYWRASAATIAAN